MRIFINNADSFVGKALCADLRSVLGQDNRLFGTLSEEALKLDNDAITNLVGSIGLKRTVSREDPHKYIADVLSCSLIVYDLHSADLADVEFIIKELKLAKLKHDTVFVLVSSVNVWAKTKKQYEPLGGEEEEEEAADEEDPDAPPKEVKMRPQVLKDVDLDRRIPGPEYEPWKYMETLALSMCPKEKLRPHVICSGVLYGNGEQTFNDLFRAAWLTKPSHVILEPGTNYIPCIHVRDVARLVKVLATNNSINPYLIAVDKSWSTQADIVQAIVNQISDKREVPLVPTVDLTDEQDTQMDPAVKRIQDMMMLDLIVEPSAPMRAKDFPWWCKKGLIKELPKVADEFCTWRNLRPIKLAVIGPPGSGTEKISRMIAAHYWHDDPPHFTFDQVLKDATSDGTEAGQRLRKKVDKLAKWGRKLDLKKRTKLLTKKLTSNVCRYRGYVLEGYPLRYEDAEALFTELKAAEGEDEPPAEEEEEEEAEEEEEDDEAPPPPEEEPPAPTEEDEEEDPAAPKRVPNTGTMPEFVIVLKSSKDRCKTRIFSGEAGGATSEEQFIQSMAEYSAANLREDGKPVTSDFFSEIGGIKVLHVDVDNCDEVQVFQGIKTYLESKGQFFNYLRSEQDRQRERQEKLALIEQEADEKKEQAKRTQIGKEHDERKDRADKEAKSRQKIANEESHLLESEATPLRQYLMANVVPTVTDGLVEVCKSMPDDPIEYLAEYLFAHAHDISGKLDKFKD